MLSLEIEHIKMFLHHSNLLKRTRFLIYTKLEKAILSLPIDKLGEKAEELLEKMKVPYVRIFHEDPKILLATELGTYRGIVGVKSYTRAYCARTQ